MACDTLRCVWIAPAADCPSTLSRVVREPPRWIRGHRISDSFQHRSIRHLISIRVALCQVEIARGGPTPHGACFRVKIHVRSGEAS